MVSVLATAHMHPARIAHTTRCGAWRTSARTCDVPRISAGTLQRARKTPHTITSDTVTGEMSGFTSLIGASAPPSHAPAAKPQKIPSACRLRKRLLSTGVCTTDNFGDCSLSWLALNGVCPGAQGRPEEH